MNRTTARFLPPALFALCLALVAALLILVFSFFTKNIRYGVVLELPIRVFSASMICELGRRLGGRVAVALSGLLVGGLCWLEWRSFELLWIRHNGFDPITAVLVVMRDLMPRPLR